MKEIMKEIKGKKVDITEWDVNEFHTGFKAELENNGDSNLEHH